MGAGGIPTGSAGSFIAFWAFDIAFRLFFEFAVADFDFAFFIESDDNDFEFVANMDDGIRIIDIVPL